VPPWAGADFSDNGAVTRAARVSIAVAVFVLTVLVSGCGSRSASPVEKTGVWSRVTAAREGVDAKRLAAADRWAQSRVPALTSLLVARHGRLVFERYYHLGAPNQRVPILSVTKSIISTLVGIALADGKLKTLDVKLRDVLGSDIPADADPRVPLITLRELLTMTAGFGSTATDPFGDGGNAYRTTPNWVHTILGSPPATDPGTAFAYDNGDAHLVSAILQHVTGETAAAFARANLFHPLRINPGNWSADRQGVTDGAAGLELYPRDLAKLGELYLRAGRWGDRQVVPALYVRAATTGQVSPEAAVPGLGYGYFWWTYRGPGVPRLFLALGSGGQFVIVVPSRDAVIVLTSSSTASTPGATELTLALHALQALG
jgi:CubicO group peptidase (beta-lactamase class C family)